MSNERPELHLIPLEATEEQLDELTDALWEQIQAVRGSAGTAGQFDPSQPRDESGRWTSGGGSSGGGGSGDEYGGGRVSPASISGPTEGPRAGDKAVLDRPATHYTAASGAGAKTETFDRFRNADGSFTPERQALHEAIIRKHFAEVQPSDTPTVLVLGGGPASGKTTVLTQDPFTNSVGVSADDIKGMLPEYRKGVAAGDREAAARVHEESSYLSKQVAARAVRDKFNVLIDGVGDNSYERLKAQVEGYRQKGHRVVARYVTVDTETAVQRMLSRARRTGRYVPESYLREVHAKVSRILPRAMGDGLFDNVKVYDNVGRRPVLIASARRRGRGGQVRVHDADRWDQFVAKGLAGNVAENIDDEPYTMDDMTRWVKAWLAGRRTPPANPVQRAAAERLWAELDALPDGAIIELPADAGS